MPNTACLICERDEETICPRCLGVWTGKAAKLSTDRLNFLNLIEVLLERYDREEIELGVMLTQKIWPRWNSIVYGGPFTHLAQIVKEAKATMEDFH
jgi:hypothetical protein